MCSHPSAPMHFPSCAFMPFLLQPFRFALNDGLLHITCLFGSGDEPRPSIMDKDPFGLLLVRHPKSA